jgi:hypothetical protein
MNAKIVTPGPLGTQHGVDLLQRVAGSGLV